MFPGDGVLPLASALSSILAAIAQPSASRSSAVSVATGRTAPLAIAPAIRGTIWFNKSKPAVVVMRSFPAVAGGLYVKPPAATTRVWAAAERLD
jgi:hypothetical protein